jgi:hypothetical protein
MGGNTVNPASVNKPISPDSVQYRKMVGPGAEMNADLFRTGDIPQVASSVPEVKGLVDVFSQGAQVPGAHYINPHRVAKDVLNDAMIASQAKTLPMPQGNELFDYRYNTNAIPKLMTQDEQVAKQVNLARSRASEAKDMSGRNINVNREVKNAINKRLDDRNNEILNQMQRVN